MGGVYVSECEPCQEGVTSKQTETNRAKPGSVGINHDSCFLHHCSVTIIDVPDYPEHLPHTLLGKPSYLVPIIPPHYQTCNTALIRGNHPTRGLAGGAEPATLPAGRKVKHRPVSTNQIQLASVKSVKGNDLIARRGWRIRKDGHVHCIALGLVCFFFSLAARPGRQLQYSDVA
ncbi:uncharacterized protein BO97DRAFT_187451 [Aspergillus homomorphus CBS 101889]|uniref:Uncharacterized protein n=1 Tax=Aspergillus homomorphus (strain CBS 101889) TaxID=1450537 RepID=A0A395HQA5_ASPHC|nr:hypothetical protein BO97DRAFT_187451 [Aspergillus homomorphus CBS 101889]RAL09038.1 hypothetical protein BO97DRAFT_187451 [Aspergillus homomorphus CBS 101889]